MFMSVMKSHDTTELPPRPAEPGGGERLPRGLHELPRQGEGRQEHQVARLQKVRLGNIAGWSIWGLGPDSIEIIVPDQGFQLSRFWPVSRSQNCDRSQNPK